MSLDAATEKLLQRDRLVTLGGLAAIAGLAWAYLWALAAEMNMLSDVMAEMARLRPWTADDVGLMFVMWATMMVAMMAPSATPVILLYARVYRGRDNKTQSSAPTGAFFAGYIAVWVGFSLVMTLLQWGMEQAALLSPMMASTSPGLGGLVLIAAGVYQWLPAKNVCLSHCRSPVHFLSTHWRAGALGAFRMGLEHGLYCLGCCWALMLLLFVGGVMNLLWVAAIALFVLIEKVAPFGRAAGQVGSLLLIAGGVAVIGGA
jgi:predicted metal-binding membrane protein